MSNRARPKIPSVGECRRASYCAGRAIGARQNRPLGPNIGVEIRLEIGFFFVVCVSPLGSVKLFLLVAFMRLASRRILAGGETMGVRYEIRK